MRFLAPGMVILFMAGTASGDAIEEWVEASSESEAVQEWLDGLRQKPLNLNSADAEEISRLPFFDDVVSKRIIEVRRAQGYFRGIDDLIAAISLTNDQRESLFLFSTVKPPEERGLLRGVSQFSESEPQNRMRADFTMGRVRHGFLFVADRSGTADVSAGIEFLHERSASRVIAGDYQIEAGTGLVLASAYGMANWLSSQSSLRPSSPQSLRATPTSNDLSRFRGGAVQTQHEWVRGAIIGSIRRLDALLDSSGVTRLAENETAGSDLTRAREDQVEERVIGLALETSRFEWSAGVTGYQAHFAPSLEPAASLDSKPYFSGNRLSIGSVHVRGAMGRANIVTEAAASDPGGYAHQSALAVLGERLGISAYHVFAAANFYSPHSRIWGGFGADASNQQQSGVKLRVTWPHEVLSMHAWNSRSPFRTSQFPLSRSSSGIALRSGTEIAPALSLVILADREWREYLQSDQISMLNVNRGRVELAVTEPAEFKLRVELKTAGTEGTSSHSTGSLLFLQWKLLIHETSVFLRVTFFDAEDYDVALRVYENAPAGMFPLVTFTESGRRAAIMVSRRFGIIRGALKAAHTVKHGLERDQILEAVAQVGLAW